jgi:hemerythrin-like domain-containing protein
MTPIGPLMIEHRLIERMIALMEMELQKAEKGKPVNSRFVQTSTRFIRDYADRCHHGKEEDILFRALEQKALSDEHKRTMHELVEEHRLGRETTARLVKANARYEKGDKDGLPEIVDCLRLLIDFYPRHIEKEDRRFFIPIMRYFSESEKEGLLNKGYEFDSGLLHEHYAGLVSKCEEEEKERLQKSKG